jgi:putative ABC transport system substrate-binding protein
MPASDLNATLAVHCGNGFDAGCYPYQSARLIRYNAASQSSRADMKRRKFIALIGGVAAAWPLAARGQPTKKMPKVGVLWHAGSAEQEAPYFGSLLEGFKSLGYVEGRNIRFEHRFPGEIPERFKSMGAELVSSGIDVLVLVGNNAAPYANDLTTTIPVVFTLVGDPVGLKLVASLARPGGNVTGLASFAAELIPKRLELLKDIVPGLSRVALLANMNAKITGMYINLSEAAAAQLGLTIQTFEVRSPDELEPAFDAMVKGGMQALTSNADGLGFTHRAVIAKFALARRLPLAAFSRESFETGALISYGVDNGAICRRTAVYVDKILKGATPAELPVEQPTKFEFLINLKTANALGITIPPTLLTRADEVVE